MVGRASYLLDINAHKIMLSTVKIKSKNNRRRRVRDDSDSALALQAIPTAHSHSHYTKSANQSVAARRPRAPLLRQQSRRRPRDNCFVLIRRFINSYYQK